MLVGFQRKSGWVGLEFSGVIRGQPHVMRALLKGQDCFFR